MHACMVANDPQLAVGPVYVLDRSALPLLFESPGRTAFNFVTSSFVIDRRTTIQEWTGTRRFHAHKAKAPCHMHVTVRLGVD